MLTAALDTTPASPARRTASVTTALAWCSRGISPPAQLLNQRFPQGKHRCALLCAFGDLLAASILFPPPLSFLVCFLRAYSESTFARVVSKGSAVPEYLEAIAVLRPLPQFPGSPPRSPHFSLDSAALTQRNQPLPWAPIRKQEPTNHRFDFF